MKLEIKKGLKQFQKIDGKLQDEIAFKFLQARKNEWREEFIMFRR